MDKRLILSFKGDKVELHNQLKVWCAIADTNMNSTVIFLIEELMNNNDVAELIRQKITK